jgi:hypothetical protein
MDCMEAICGLTQEREGADIVQDRQLVSVSA